MDAEQKAKELVNSFYQPLGYLKCGVNNTIMWEHAKQYALIAVDEILNSRKKHLVQSINFYEYWQEVKKEIQKL